MSDRNKHNEFQIDFFRYINNEMSNVERNQFEQGLERDPFDAEALEGFENFKLNDIQKDLRNLNIASGKKSNRKLIFYISIAASIAILVVSTVLVVRIQKENPDQLVLTIPVEPSTRFDSSQFADAKIIDTTTIITDTVLIAENIIVTEDKLPIPTKQVIPKAKKEETVRPPVMTTAKKVGGLKVEQELTSRFNETVEDKTTIISGSAKTNEYKTLTGVIKYSGKVLSAENNQPLPGVNIRVNDLGIATITDTDGYFQLQIPEGQDPQVSLAYIGMLPESINASDIGNNIIMQPDQLALEEVVAIGYGTNESEASVNTEAMPLGGNTLFKKYLEENLVYPQSIENPKREVVRIKFTVSTNGELSNFVIIKSDTKEFSDEAIRVLQNGPKWSPAISNRQAINSETSLRIVFKP